MGTGLWPWSSCSDWCSNDIWHHRHQETPLQSTVNQAPTCVIKRKEMGGMLSPLVRSGRKGNPARKGNPQNDGCTFQGGHWQVRLPDNSCWRITGHRETGPWASINWSDKGKSSNLSPIYTVLCRMIRSRLRSGFQLYILIRLAITPRDSV